MQVWGRELGRWMGKEPCLPAQTEKEKVFFFLFFLFENLISNQFANHFESFLKFWFKYTHHNK